MAFTNNKGRTQSSLSEINITPFVDVVLVLLVMFMVTAPILQSGIEVEVPKTKTVKEITEERLVITIDKDQRVFLGNDPININEIADRLHEKIRDPQGQSIFIRSDENVPFGAFATVMDAVKQTGITNVSIVTQPLNYEEPMPLDADIYGYKEAMTPSLAVSAALHAALLACLVFLPAVLSHSGEDWGNNGSGGASRRSHQRPPGQWNSACLPIPRPSRKTCWPTRARDCRNRSPRLPQKKTSKPSPFPTSRAR